MSTVSVMVSGDGPVEVWFEGEEDQARKISPGQTSNFEVEFASPLLHVQAAVPD